MFLVYSNARNDIVKPWRCWRRRERNTGAVNEALRAAVLLAVSFCIAVELLFRSIDEETLELFISSLWSRY